eukprot:m.280379 g.280379  ORF g.280379 m.280379 type:complete len:98 (-) comp54918_c0_seq9:2364-2657(-)
MNVLACKLSLRASSSLLDDQTKLSLNPMSIRIEKIQNLPSTPMSFSSLAHLCDPVWIHLKPAGRPHSQFASSPTGVPTSRQTFASSSSWDALNQRTC